MNLQISLFDYAMLDTETRIVVQQRTDEIKTLMRRSAQDVIDIGQKLIDVKARLGHGNFGDWVEGEFQWSQMTATKFINVAKTFSNLKTSLNLNMGFETLALLANSSTPDSVRTEALQRAESGEKITHAVAKAIVAEAKPTVQLPHQESKVPIASYESTDSEEELNDWDEAAAPLAPAEQVQVWEKAVEIAPDSKPTARDVEIAKGIVAKTAISSDPSYDGNEWYTPENIITLARDLFGGIDLDPCSCKEAQEVVKAKSYFTKDQNCLDREWFGHCWLNPPYSFPEIRDITSYAIDQYRKGNCESVLILTNNCTDAGWFQELAEFPVVFISSRIQFWRPNNEKFGTRQGQALFYLGSDIEDFFSTFLTVGYAPNRGH